MNAVATSVVSLERKLEVSAGAILDDKAYNDLCCRLCEPARSELNRAATETFRSHLDRVNTVPDNIITAWGGVDIITRNHPYVEKYLVVRGGAWLALEKHSEKDEFLTIEEGSVYVISRREGTEDFRCDLLEAGQSVRFKPGQEHALIAPRNALVREQGMDYLGMDQDLIFLRYPDPARYLAQI